MIGICQKCGSHEWNRVVEGNTITCPDCGERWNYIKKPLYILTGCSGIGKTTTAQELQKTTTDFVFQDADIFYNIMPGETEEDAYDQVEQVGLLSKNIMQSGKPVVWTMAGNIDKIPHTYNARFFSEIRVLALVADEQSIRKRMTEGRKITDENWIEGSVSYNNYFKTHTQLGNTKFEVVDTEGKTVAEVAGEVLEWLRK